MRCRSVSSRGERGAVGSEKLAQRGRRRVFIMTLCFDTVSVKAMGRRVDIALALRAFKLPIASVGAPNEGGDGRGYSVLDHSSDLLPMRSSFGRTTSLYHL